MWRSCPLASGVSASVLAWVVVAGSACIPGCGLPEGEYFGTVAERPDASHFRFCNSGEPASLDPAMLTGSVGLPLSYALFDGLTGYNLQGLPEPSLATHWEISPDQRRFTFHLHDRGRWSNGKPVTAHDFAYHFQRVLHPSTGSYNAEPLWKIKSGQMYTAGRVKRVLRDAPPFRAGDVVEVLEDLPDSNLRTADRALALRDRGAPESAAYARVPAGEPVTLIELADGPDGESWAYVHWPDGEGVYGWVPAEVLTGQPNGEVLYRVREIPEPHRVGVEIPPERIHELLDAPREQGAVAGRDLLMTPDVLGVRAQGDWTLVIETWGPVPYFIDMTPQHAFRATPRDQVSRHPLRWTKPAHIVTSGPLHLTAWYERDRLELVRSPTHWQRERVSFERLTAYSMDDQAASTNYYMHGGCDAVATNHIPSSYLRVLSRAPGEKPRYKDFLSGPSLSVYFYLFNSEKVANVHLRRALAYAIDRRPIVRLLHGGQIPTAQFMAGVPIEALDEADLRACGVPRDHGGVAMVIQPGALCYVPPSGLDFDPEQARRELALAREQMGADFPSRLSLTFNLGTESHRAIAEYVQASWREVLGLHIELSSQEWKTYLQATLSGDFEIARFGAGSSFPDPESEILSMFKCDSPNNRARWCNPEFEQYFRAAESMPDRSRRLELIHDAERVLVQDAPVIPIYVYTNYQLQKPYVRDMPLNPTDKQPLHLLWIDPDWRSREVR